MYRCGMKFHFNSHIYFSIIWILNRDGLNIFHTFLTGLWNSGFTYVHNLTSELMILELTMTNEKNKNTFCLFTPHHVE